MSTFEFDENEASLQVSFEEEEAINLAAEAAKRTVGKVIPEDDCVIEDGTLTDYFGDEKDIILPDGITAVGDSVFLTSDITSVVIPEGVETIESDAFFSCQVLKEVVLPSTLKKIGEGAFQLDKILPCVVIPDGCEEIGPNVFFFCDKLLDIYVPASVYEIGEDALGTYNSATVIHTPKGSYAESYAMEHDLKYDNKPAPTDHPAADPSRKPAAPAKNKKPEDLSESIDDLRAQLDALTVGEFSEKDKKTLDDVQKQIEKLDAMFSDGQNSINKYENYLAEKETKEKAEKEKKAKKKADALAAGISEKDIVNMYVILTNEKKLGKLGRTDEEFSEIYGEDFPALSKEKILQTRKDMLEEMEDASLCGYYAESFKQRTVEERFNVSTWNLNNVKEGEPYLDVKAKWAIENTKEWFAPEEIPEVRRLADAKLAEIKKQIDEQFGPIEEKWMKFRTATEFLKLFITEKKPDDSDLESNASCFQIVLGDALVTVKLSTKGIFRMFAVIPDFTPWYWGVTIRDVWEAACRNDDISDERTDAADTAQIKEQALKQVRAKYPASEAKPQASGKTAPAPSKPSAPPKPANAKKKEGCYIATAVYGSYDAPQVLTLRRYRDETLAKSVLGRWFIRVYYRLSPPIAKLLKKAKHINAFVRSILNRWVDKLNRKMR